MTTGAHTSRHPRAALAVVCAAVFMAMLDNLAVNNALPSIAADLDAGVSKLQWVVAAYTLVFAATLLSASVVGGRLGQHRAFVAGLLGFMTGSALASAARDWGLLVAGRVVQGLGAAVVLPAGTALLRHVFTDGAARTRALGMRGAAGGLGVALGPAIGGPLTSTLGWRSVMWINLPVGAATLAAAVRVLPRPPAVPLRWDPAGQVLAVCGLGSLVYALVQGPVDSWHTPPVLAALAMAAVALPAFVVVEARGQQPMLDLALFRDRPSGAAAAAVFTSSAGLFGSIFFLTFYLQGILGWSAAGAGAVFLSASAFIALTSPVAALLTGRYGVRVPLSAGLALNTLALLGLSHYGRRAAYADYGWLLPVLGAGAGLLFVPTVITMVERAPAARAGSASAVVDTLREVGGAVGVAALGAVLTTRMRTALRDRATDAGLPQAEARHLADAAVDGGPGRGFDGRHPAAGWVQDSFIDGLHLALRCGALAMACTLLVAVVLLRVRKGD
ncbi:MFS transporter [Streptomyces sp. ET3-23]|uniref:MFS transporter n=1 Tax=Streptomyces sp. ET3-23 TaxID=2885643 RepID=UPI001D11FDC5|nr:MFS transporter [Streptomyces sp. ET3-23]MCC2280087.1 MFS transporter [Streptomyces sp. ET3-23]